MQVAHNVIMIKRMAFVLSNLSQNPGVDKIFRDSKVPHVVFVFAQLVGSDKGEESRIGRERRKGGRWKREKTFNCLWFSLGAVSHD